MIMTRLKHFIFTLVALAVILPAADAMAYEGLRFHCDKDTAEIDAMLRSPDLADMTQAQRVSFFARNLVGAQSGLRKEILEAEEAPMAVNIHELTPLSFISACIALAQAYETSSAPGWRDFAEKYEKVMYKNGEQGDFVSRFLYPSDWIADNIFRGNVSDVTQRMEDLPSRRKEKSLDYISHHPDDFKALKNPELLEKMKMLEMGFRNHQIPYISTGDLTNPKRFKPLAQDGDIVFLLCQDFNLDCREMGILQVEGDRILFIQISPTGDKVTIEDLPFELYVKRNVKRIQGARIIRIN